MLKQADLGQFIGSTSFYQHFLGITYTEGVHHVAEEGEAYWLIDAIASWQADPKVKQDPKLQDIQFWKLVVKEDDSAQLICERDTDDVVLIQEIAYTDFPLTEIRFYLTYSVLMLPSEY